MCNTSTHCWYSLLILPEIDVCSAHLIVKLLGTEEELHVTIVARNFLSMHLRGNTICHVMFCSRILHYFADMHVNYN